MLLEKLREIPPGVSIDERVRLLRLRKVSLQIELIGNESLSHRRGRRAHAESLAWALRPLRR